MPTSIFMKTCLTLLFALCISFADAQVFNNEVEAKINLASKDQFIRITGSATNKTDISRSLRYVLSVVKTDGESGNRSKNDQQGRFVLEPGEKKNLSETTINANASDRTIVFLLLYEGDQVIGKDRIVLNGFEGEDELKPLVLEKDAIEQELPQKEHDGVSLRGIVVEETKTKPGRDFYQLFYSAYLANNINGERMVKITEELAMGRNTKIQVLIDQDLVFEFFVNPRQEYLKQMSDISMHRVRRYFQTLDAKQNQQIRY